MVGVETTELYAVQPAVLGDGFKSWLSWLYFLYCQGYKETENNSWSNVYKFKAVYFQQEAENLQNITMDQSTQ